MNKKLPLILISALVLGACSRHHAPATGHDAAMPSSDATASSVANNDPIPAIANWPGVYRGVLPCADCPGIDTTVTLFPDGRYREEAQYLEGGSYENSGQLAWDATGTRITPDDPGDGYRRQFRILEDAIQMLDIEGNPITGSLARMYVLRRISR